MPHNLSIMHNKKTKPNTAEEEEEEEEEEDLLVDIQPPFPW
jgi:hypothetical protein